MEHLFEVLFEDDELLVLNKPAGLVCHPTKTDERSSLIGRVRIYLGVSASGQPDPHLINRLDRETSGIIIVGKNAETASELGKLFESRAVEKEYLALVHGYVSADHGIIDAPLGKDDHSRVAIKDCVRADGAPASTEFWVEQHVSRFRSALCSAAKEAGPLASRCTPETFSFLRLRPRTGRKHQIRIHLAHLGHPVVGDKLYGGDEDLYLALVEDRLTAEQRNRLILPHHALHASEVRFNWRGQEGVFRAEPEPWFLDWLRAQATT